MEIKIVKKVLEAHEKLAEEIARLLARNGVYAINIIGSPGSGKTLLLERTFEAAAADLKPGVIEGDIATTADAERLQRFGVPVVQINTGPFGGDCHLAPNLIRAALEELPLDDLKTVFVENVGNLVCPAEFNIGENEKVVVLSLAEGEDKPLKYPLAFREANAVVVNKTDLLPHLDVDLDVLRRNVAAVNAGLAVFEASAKTCDGVGSWVEYVRGRLVGR
ncbi:MAG: hydrogenase nickel incorporation protein HypB [candidate division Zixibacteria bacterium]|nr:hydrogenase nickel incorporation protein HypB [candidate division Zixibacteria bacterium]